MKIAFDLDDVLAPFNPAFIEFHNKSYGTSFEVSNITSYNLWELWNGTREEAAKRIFEFNASDYPKNLKPFSEAIKIVDLLLSKKHQLIVITSRSKQIEEVTRKWLTDHFPNKFNDVFITNNYPVDNQIPLEKGDICVANNVDIMIEDSLEWAEKCAENNIKVFLINKSWNQNPIKNKNITRVENLREIYETLSNV